MNDFGYLGFGLEGYAHYMQSFNDNFPEDDTYDDETFKEKYSEKLEQLEKSLLDLKI